MTKVNKILSELYSDKNQLLPLILLTCTIYMLNHLIPSDPNVIQATGLWVGIGSLALSGVNMIMGADAAADAREAQGNMDKMASDMVTENLRFQKEQQEKLDAQKEIYKGMQFKNPYAENVYEDLTVNQQQAQFQAQQGEQQRANIMQNMRGAAGGSGIAGLAQALANQGALQAQEISASIGQQESANQKLLAKGALQTQKGEADLQKLEMDRQATLLGISMGESAGANAALTASQDNLMANLGAEAGMLGQQSANYYGAAGDAFKLSATNLGTYLG